MKVVLLCNLPALLFAAWLWWDVRKFCREWREIDERYSRRIEDLEYTVDKLVSVSPEGK